ncbi:hypothetical protein VHEMI05766 [[Torrubiella] hemipterigena]|uniref:Uncharacterized protein n=1 Tax=[Torrubiella] hemipterigena TaxID=1531966 RepID=A0A0A1TJI1_9HYPO|nr:hypothetical protein VHEMI05766 [[Torrubiella] hemipterigena]
MEGNPADEDDYYASVDEVKSWLHLLLHQDFNREPEEFYIERRRDHEHRLKYPEYSFAAKTWPVYAHSDLYWPEIKPLVRELFKTPSSWNFVQWYLEYAKQTCPHLYGENAASHDALLDLTDGLCNGTVAPIHVAASLSMGEVVSWLSNDTYQCGFLGSPLFCALAGTAVLPLCLQPSGWLEKFELPYLSRSGMQATVQHLFDGAGDALINDTGASLDKIGRRVNRAANHQLICLAFCASLIVDDIDVFSKVMTRYRQLDIAPFMQLLTDIEIADVPDQKTKIAERISCAMDCFLESWNSESQTRAMQRLHEFLDENAMTLISSKIPGLTDEEFLSTIHTCILDDDLSPLKRLTMDPRFDPNAVAFDHSVSGGNLIHMAAANDNILIALVLLAAGADPNKRDNRGRTALMSAESNRILATLLAAGPRVDIGATDVDGNTIWHYATATGEFEWITMLLTADTAMAKHLAMKNSRGCTPLDSAFRYILTLQDRLLFRTSSETEYFKQIKVIHLLLEIGAPFSEETNGWHISQLAVSWGDAYIVESLNKKGVSFRGTEKFGGAMGYLNTAASAELVGVLQRLCSGQPAACRDDLTAADVILGMPLLKQTQPSDPSERTTLLPTEHPACLSILDARAYDKLLTSDTLEQRDRNGRTFWQRFCRDATQIIGRYDRKYWEISVCYLESVDVALNCLLKSKALSVYEAASGLPAFVPMIQLADKHTVDWMLDSRRLLLIIEASDPILTEKYLTGNLSGPLVDLILPELQVDLTSILIKRGLPVHSKLGGEHPSLIETMVEGGGPLELLAFALVRCSTEMINERIEDYSTALINSKRHNFPVLEMLLKHGFASEYKTNPVHMCVLRAQLEHSRGTDEQSVKLLEKLGLDN